MCQLHLSSISLDFENSDSAVWWKPESQNVRIKIFVLKLEYSLSMIGVLLFGNEFHLIVPYRVVGGLPCLRL